MEFAAGLRRFRQSVPHVPRPLAPRGLGGLQRASRRQRELTEAYNDLAGLFVGEGGVDGHLVGALLDPSVDIDDALLELAAGRRAKIRGRFDAAIEHYGTAIESARARGSHGVVAHAAHDCARAMLARDRPGDVSDCLRMLGDAREAADACGMVTLRTRVEQLAIGIRDLIAETELSLGARA